MKEEATAAINEGNKASIEASLKDIGIHSKAQALNILTVLLERKEIALAQVKAAHDESCNGETKSTTSANNNDDDANSINVKLSKNKQKRTKSSTNKQPIERQKYMTRHIALRFHYDGSTYSGLAQNMNSPTDNSVEKYLFAALERTCLITSREDCNYSRCGRTDKGVSSFGQVVALRVNSAFPQGSSLPIDKTNETSNSMKEMIEDDLPKNSLQSITCWAPPKRNNKKRKPNNHTNSNNTSTLTTTTTTTEQHNGLIEKTIQEKNFASTLNNVLPPTIRVIGWTPVSQQFSARFSASSRTYRYFFIRRDLNLNAMKDGLDKLVGKHDFRNLCKMNCEEIDNFVRVIDYAKIVVQTPNGSYRDYDSNLDEANNKDEIDYIRPECYFELKGQAFLWHQIRCIVSILFMIGKQYESPNIISQLLDIQTNPSKPFYPFAPEVPLVLHDCGYRNLTMGQTAKNLWRVSCDLESKWESLVISATQIRNGLFSMKSETKVLKSDVLDFVRELELERKKKYGTGGTAIAAIESMDDNNNDDDADSLLSWEDALKIIYQKTSRRPSADGPTLPLHQPLMERGKSTTFEEKVQAILSAPDSTTEKNGLEKHERKNSLNVVTSSKRKARYDENMSKKAKSKDLDQVFYENMMDQGGSGF